MTSDPIEVLAFRLSSSALEYALLMHAVPSAALREYVELTAKSQPARAIPGARSREV